MRKIGELAGKTAATLREDGLRKVGEKASLYFKRKRIEKQEEGQIDGLFRDVLFINGCDEHLPHPARYRVTHQREQLASLGITTGEIYYQNLQLTTVRCYRAFVFFRCPYTETIGTFVKTAKALNKAVLYDIDDLVIDTVYTDTIKYLDTMSTPDRQAYDDGVRSMGKLLKLCDGAITTTNGLAEELELYVSKVLINRNVASEEMVSISRQVLSRKQHVVEEHARQVLSRKQHVVEEPLTQAENTSSKNDMHGGTQASQHMHCTKLGYFSGSITHNDDFELILPVITRLLEDYPQMELHLVGELTLPEALYPYQKRIISHPFTDWRKLPELIAQVDINLAPLNNTIFNRAKSEIKWIEAALVGVPTVASDIGAFHTMIENGKTGILCQNDMQWEEALRALIEQPQYRKLLGDTACEFCSSHCVTAVTGMELAEFIRSMCSPNIAFVLPAFQVSGGVMVALQHSRILQRAGWDVTLLSIDEKGKEQWYEFQDSQFPVLNLHNCRLQGQLDQGVATMWSTVSYLERYPSILTKSYLVQNYEADFYAPGGPLRLQARETYGNHPGLQYLTISHWCKKWLQEQYHHDAKYAPNGLDYAKFTGEVEESGKAQVQVELRSEVKPETSQRIRMEAEPETKFVARAGAARKIRILIEGDCSAPHKNVDESFHIVEQLDLAKYEIWYMAYHGEPKSWYRVDRFLSQVPYAEVPEIYRQCDILLKTSLLESFSYPPLEMMATGGFVVALLNDGNAEYLRSGENCLTYPQGDIAQAVAAIQRINSDQILRERLQKGGRETAASRDWNILKDKIISLYTK